MKKVIIKAIRRTVYPDLIEKYERNSENACDIEEGMVFISLNGLKPKKLCQSAWESMEEFVTALSRGEGNFYDGWMKNPYSAMISCNDGFRPVSFLIEAVDDEQ